MASRRVTIGIATLIAVAAGVAIWAPGSARNAARDAPTASNPGAAAPAVLTGRAPEGTTPGATPDADVEALRNENRVLREQNRQLTDALTASEAKRRALDPLSALTADERKRLESARAWLIQVTGRTKGHDLEDLLALERLGLARVALADGDDISDHLAALPSLRTMNFAGASITSKHLRALPKRTTTIFAHGADVRDAAGVESILHLADSLEGLLLPTPWGDPAQLELLAKHFTKLKHLSCLHAANITDAGLRHIVRLPALRELRIANCKAITSRGLQLLARLPIQSLDVNGCKQFTDADLRTIAELPKLEHLQMHGVPIDGSGLIHLQKLTSLQALHMSGTKIDGCAAALAAIPALKYVDVRGTPLADNAPELAALATLRPKLQVVSKR